MTVPTETCHAEFAFTGAERSFNTGIRAFDVAHVTVTYDPAAPEAAAFTLLNGVHLVLARDPASNAITATTLAMPPAPGTVIFDRQTPATQPTVFVNLGKYDAAVHEHLADASAMRDAELRFRQGQGSGPPGPAGPGGPPGPGGPAGPVGPGGGAREGALVEQFRPVERDLYSLGIEGLDHGVYPLDAHHQGYAKPFDFDRAVYPEAFYPTIRIHAATAQIEYRVWKRPQSTPSLDGPGRGVIGTADVIFLNWQSASLAQAGVNNGPDPQEPRLGLEASGRWELGFTHIVEIRQTDAGLNVLDIATGWGGERSGTAPLYRAGWYSPDAFNWVPNVPGFSMSGRITERGFTPVYARAEPDDERVSYLGPAPELRTAVIEQTVNDLTTIVIPPFEILRTSGPLRIPSQTITVAAIGFEHFAAQPHILFNNQGIELSRKYATNLEVYKETAPGSGVFTVLLTRGVHYQLADGPGIMRGTDAGTDNVAIQTTYDGTKERRDKVVVDRLSGVVSVVTGTNRARDVDMYRPATPAGKLLLLDLHVRLFGTKYHVELIPSCLWRDGIRIGEEGELMAEMARNRDCVPKAMKALRRGTPVDVIGYGTSNIERGAPEGGVAERVHGDNIAFYGNMGLDAQALLPQQPPEVGTGFIRTTVNFPWDLVRIFQNNWGVLSSYFNFGVSGSTSDTTLVGATYNGAHPTRLTALKNKIAAQVALGHAVVVVIEFSANEPASILIRGNIVAIIDAIRLVGGEPYVMGVTPWNAMSPTMLENVPQPWHIDICHDGLSAAARERDAAFCNTKHLFRRGAEGATGLSQNIWGAQNSYNHPGAAEVAEIGKLIARPFR